MAWFDRVGRGGGRGVTVGRSQTVAALAVVVLVLGVATLSGVLAPVGPADVSFPVIGDGGGGDVAGTDTNVTVGGEAVALDGGDGSAGALEAEGPDTDRDGLTDAAEAELGTDPQAADTDGDGYPDGMEVGCGDRLPGADPLQQDVFVEVDSVAGASLSPGAIDRLEASFANAPVENPGPEDGIALHLVESDGDLREDGPVNNRPRPGERSDIGDYRTEHFDRAALGYHYLLVVSDAAYNGDRSYAGAGHRGNVVVEHYERDGVMASLIMHELGHAFGITHASEGVDEERYGLAEYRSVMNYNGIYEVMTYSDGTDDVGRDEWAFVGQDRHLPALDCPTGDCTALCATGD